MELESDEISRQDRLVLYVAAILIVAAWTLSRFLLPEDRSSPGGLGLLGLLLGHLVAAKYVLRWITPANVALVVRHPAFWLSTLLHAGWATVFLPGNPFGRLVHTGLAPFVVAWPMGFVVASQHWLVMNARGIALLLVLSVGTSMLYAIALGAIRRLPSPWSLETLLAGGLLFLCSAAVLTLSAFFVAFLMGWEHSI